MTRGGGSLMDQLNETPVTYALLLIYVTMAYLTKSLGFDSDSGLLVVWGGATGILIQDGEWWRMFSHAVNHANLIHLGLNAYALVTFGPMIERYLGVWRFIVLYVASALAGCVVALMWTPPYLTLVGGSGALFGMLGAAIALQIRGGRTTLDFIQNTGSRHLIGIVVINLLIGFFIPFVSNAAHIGGLIGGFVVVYCYFDKGRRSITDTTGRMIQIGWLLLLLSLVGYQLRPVLRFDCQLREFLTETDPGRRKLLRSLVNHVYLDGADQGTLLENEKEPKTGVFGVALYEHYFNRYNLTSAADALARWKQSYAGR